jgi:YVTN family beta-propeller protein
MASCRTRALRALISAAALTALLAVAAAPADARNAYVANSGDGSVTVLDADTNAVIGAVALGGEPSDVAITPDGSLAFVANLNGTVSVIATATNQVVAGPIAVGAKPRGIAISPDGVRAYVSNSADDTVSVIDVATRGVAATVHVGSEPEGIAFSPDGTRAFVAQRGGDVSIVDTASSAVAGTIADALGPARISIGPRGGRGYITNSASTSISPFVPASGAVGAPIAVGGPPLGIATTPNGQFAYVTSPESGTVTVVNAALDSVAGAPVTGFPGAAGIAIDPDGAHGYVTDGGGNTVTLLDSVHNLAAGPIQVGAKPAAVAVVPDQPPTAGFFVSPSHKVAKRRLTFRAGASTDPDGKIVEYAWDFGDRHHTHGTKTTVFHRYRKPGTYLVTLKVTDENGCSTERVFTGQTVSCNGSPIATATQAIVVGNGRGPALRLAAGRRQRLKGRVDVWALCPREPCSVRARGFVVAKFERHGTMVSHRFWLRRWLTSLTPQGWGHMRLKEPKRLRRGVARAVRMGGRAKASITVVARDAEGDATKRHRKVKIVVPRRR